jgi:hypothetical protein
MTTICCTRESLTVEETRFEPPLAPPIDARRKHEGANGIKFSPLFHGLIVYDCSISDSRLIGVDCVRKFRLFSILLGPSRSRHVHPPKKLEGTCAIAISDQGEQHPRWGGGLKVKASISGREFRDFFAHFSPTVVSHTSRSLRRIVAATRNEAVRQVSESKITPQTSKKLTQSHHLLLCRSHHRSEEHLLCGSHRGLLERRPRVFVEVFGSIGRGQGDV